MNVYEKLSETAAYLQPFATGSPRVGVILGSGLSNFRNEIEVEKEIEYAAIPHFPVSTVQGHHGKLIFGSVGGKAILVLSGRFHFYEGHPAEDVIFPIRVMRRLGVQTLLISNAAGGVNPEFNVGDLMIITDHISLATVNPLVGKNDERIGPRFPDMSEPYKKSFVQKAKDVARRLDIDVKEGVYFGVTGPTFETRAEYKMIHLLGADAVGMSTVQEVIAARHAGMNVFAVSVITDIGIREEENVITHEEVLQAAQAAEPKLTALFKELILSIH